jgi:hypothetical protein
MQMSKSEANLALAIFSAATVIAGPITAAIATAAFVAGLVLT